MVSRVHVRPVAPVPSVAAPVASLPVTMRRSGRVARALRAFWRFLLRVEPVGGGESLADFQAKLAAYRGLPATEALWREYDVAPPSVPPQPPPLMVWRC